jgi:hypothetical protein
MRTIAFSSIILTFIYSLSFGGQESLNSLCDELRSEKAQAHQHILAKKISKYGKQSIEPLFRITVEVKDKCACYYGSLAKVLGELSIKYPQEFSRIYRSLSLNNEKWFLINAIRHAPSLTCVELISSVFNDDKEDQGIRIQCMMCLMLGKVENTAVLSEFEPGTLLLLKEKPRDAALKRVIDLAKYGKMSDATNLLINLLDIKGQFKISDRATDALNYIHNRTWTTEKWKISNPNNANSADANSSAPD